MAKLSLHIVNDGGQTRTLIAKKKDFDEIVFHNDSSKSLRIEFLHSNVFQDKHGTVIHDITVDPGRQESVWFDPEVEPGTRVKYTAKITDAEPEDPIIIFER